MRGFREENFISQANSAELENKCHLYSQAWHAARKLDSTLRAIETLIISYSNLITINEIPNSVLRRASKLNRAALARLSRETKKLNLPARSAGPHDT